MSTTFAELKTALRLILTDRSIWSTTAVDQWAKEAIQDYSSHFPLQLTAYIAASAGIREVDLAGTLGFIQNILQVEYPAGEEPLLLLCRLHQDHPAFLGGAYYDLSGDPVASLILGQTPAAGETIHLTYTTRHPLPATDEAYLTVPDEGLPALHLYVTWKALLALELDNSLDIVRKPPVIQENANSSSRAWKNYHNKIEELRRLQTRAGYSGTWSMDSKDRVY
jgi:hypothetical protein